MEEEKKIQTEEVAEKKPEEAASAEKPASESTEVESKKDLVDALYERHLTRKEARAKKHAAKEAKAKERIQQKEAKAKERAESKSHNTGKLKTGLGIAAAVGIGTLGFALGSVLKNGLTTGGDSVGVAEIPDYVDNGDGETVPETDVQADQYPDDSENN